MSVRSRRGSSTDSQMPVATSADDSNSSGITRFAHVASGSDSSTSSIEPASSSDLASSSMYSSSTPIVSGGPAPYRWSSTLPLGPLLPLPLALTDASVAAVVGAGKRGYRCQMSKPTPAAPNVSITALSAAANSSDAAMVAVPRS